MYSSVPPKVLALRYWSISMKLLLTLILACFSVVANAQIIDLSYDYDENTVYWPTADPFEKRTVSEGHTEGGFYYSAYWFATSEHGGTHLDAPIHFYENGATTDTIPLERLIGQAICIDVADSLGDDKDALINVAALQRWEAKHGQIPDDAIVLLRTGWGRFWPDAKSYLGTEQRGSEAIADLHFPGLSVEAARWLVKHRQIAAIGIDTASIDRGQSSDYQAHRVLAKVGIPIFENVANLNRLPANGFEVVALPIKLKGGSGGPLRIVAIMNESE